MSKKFRSPNGKDIRIALLSGKVAIIGNDFRELPSDMWSEAYANGAVSDDMKVTSSEDYIFEQKILQEQKEQEERQRIKDILNGLYDTPNEILNSNNELVYHKVTKQIGKVVKKDYLNAIWQEIVDEHTEA